MIPKPPKREPDDRRETQVLARSALIMAEKMKRISEQTLKLLAGDSPNMMEAELLGLGKNKGENK